jgi:hypothetical protein
MSPASARSLLFLSLCSAWLTACGGGVSDETGATEDALGEPQTRGFVTPSLALADERLVFTRYAHLDPGRLVPDNLLFDAVAMFDANVPQLRNKGHIAIVDFAKPSGKKRFFEIDMQTGSVVPHMVAHGSGSDGGNGYATRFSDTNDSHMSSLGFVVTGSTFNGEHGRSLLLFGLSPSNAHMRAREIIIHSAAYVSESSSRQGNSWGCFALDPRVKDQVVTELMGGALLYAGLGSPNGAPRPTAEGAPAPTPPPPPAPVEVPASPTGAACASDGACNPGSEGSGMICVSGTCTPGCHTNSQCPGATTCEGGTCR